MAGMSLEQGRKVFADLFAPWLQDLNLQFEQIGRDGARLRMPLDERLYRTGGTVCGQSLMALADTTMVFAVCGAAGGYRPMTTVSQSTSFLRPIAEADVIAEGRVLKLGRSLAFGEVLLYAEGSGDPAAQVSSTCALLPEK